MFDVFHQLFFENTAYHGGSAIFSADQLIISVWFADAKFKVGSLNCRADLDVEVWRAFKILAGQAHGHALCHQ